MVFPEEERTKILGEHLLNHVTAEIRELFVPAIVQEPQAILIEAQQLQDSRVEIAHVQSFI
jgi:hypothetical protein